MQKTPLDRLTVLVHREAIRQVKHIAANDRTSASRIVRDALDDYFAKKEQDARKQKAQVAA